MIRSINTELIHISQPEYVSKNRIHFEFKYDNKTGIFLQTPLSTIYEINNSILIGFPNINFNQEVNKFISLINTIDDYILTIQKELWKRIGKNTRDKKFYSSCRWNNNKTNIYMKLNLQKEIFRNTNNEIDNRPYLDVYDQNKKKQSINYIEPFSTGYHIIYIDNIWVSPNTKSMGLQWYIIQSKIYKNIIKLDECLIQDDDYDKPFLQPETHCNCCSKKLQQKSSSIPPEEHPTYGRFIKMKRMGIPIDAIKLKLEQENLSFDEFQNIQNNIPKLPPATLSISHIPSGRPNISANMLMGITLKKATINTVEPAKKEIIPLQLKEKYTPPSADELKNILARLKKTN
jgi:hypothetical protein